MFLESLMQSRYLRGVGVEKFWRMGRERSGHDVNMMGLDVTGCEDGVVIRDAQRYAQGTMMIDDAIFSTATLLW